MSRAALIIVAVVTCLAPAARAEERRASNSDELKKAIAAAKPGAVVVMADGVWKDVRIVFNGQGREDAPVTLRAATPGKVVLAGESRLSFAGKHLVVDGLCFSQGGTRSGSVIEFRTSTQNVAEHCRLTNCAVIDYNPKEKKDDTKWVSVYGTYNRVDHCYFAGKHNVGQVLVVWVGKEPNYHLIDHNHFGPRPPLGENGGEQLRVGTSEVSMNVSRSTAEWNYFENCDAEIEIVSNKSCENVYRYNTFDRCAGTLTLRHGNRCTVEGNWFFGRHKPGTGGIRVIGEDHRIFNNYLEGLEAKGYPAAITLMKGIPDSPLAGYFQVKRAVVAFNTLADNRTTLLIGGGRRGSATLPPADCVIANNLLVGSTSPLVTQTVEPQNMRWEGNVAFGAELAIPPGDGVRVVDPKLERAADGLLRPAQGSATIAAAKGEYPTVREDIDGQPRELAKDVGCDQRSSRPVLRGPPGAADTGPAWRRDGQ